jgi:quinolinate synthase
MMKSVIDRLKTTPVPSHKVKNTDFALEIKRLKKEKNAVILAHYYQEEAIQSIADYLGDSLYLAKQAEKVNADIIVFAGVHFMAETAKIVNPSKKVLLPDLNAGCSLADSCPPVDFAAFKAKYPEAVVVTYINCSAEIKALSDIVCTSSNAVEVINSIPKDKQLIFAPDKNLGRYLIKETGRDMILWDGACIVHEAFSFERTPQSKIYRASRERKSSFGHRSLYWQHLWLVTIRPRRSKRHFYCSHRSWYFT